MWLDVLLYFIFIYIDHIFVRKNLGLLAELIGCSTSNLQPMRNLKDSSIRSATQE